MPEQQEGHSRKEELSFQYPGILFVLDFAFDGIRSVPAWSVRGAGEILLEYREGASKSEISQKSILDF